MRTISFTTWLNTISVKGTIPGVSQASSIIILNNNNRELLWIVDADPVDPDSMYYGLVIKVLGF